MVGFGMTGYGRARIHFDDGTTNEHELLAVPAIGGPLEALHVPEGTWIVEKATQLADADDGLLWDIDVTRAE